MKFFPSGKLHKMQSQIFRNAQLDQIFSGPAGVSEGDSSIFRSESPVSSKAASSPKNLKEIVKQELVDTFGVSERLLNSKSGWYSEKTDFSTGEDSGFFLIPTFSGENEFSKEDLKKFIQKIKTSHPDLAFAAELIDGNYKVSFKTVKQQEPETSGSSFDNLPSVKKASNNNDEIFSELLNSRREYLYKKLRGIE
jgi:hypothetical protein